MTTTISAAAALVLGALLRVWFIEHAGSVAGDTLLYGDIAKNWMTRGVYGFAASGEPTLIRLPGYPLLMAACFRLFGMEHYTAVMYVQCAIDLATCVLVAALTWRLFGRRAALVALWLAALCPFVANYVAAPLTETPTLATIALAFYGLERWRALGAGWNRWVWVMAAALAYSLLLRPEQGLLAAVVVPAMAWTVWRDGGGVRVKTMLPVAVVIVCVGLPLVPWTVRNWRTFHVFEPLAPRSATDPGEQVPTGFYRWYRTWAIDFASTDAVYWNYNAAEIDIADLPTRAFDTDEQYLRTEALLTEYNRTCDAKPAFDAQFAKLAAERIADNPLRYYVALPVARVVNMVLRPRTELLPVSLDWWKWSKHPGESAFSLAFAGLNLCYLVVGLLGWWRWQQRQWDGNAALAWAMMAYVLLRLALLLTMDNSEPRYTLEFFPCLIVWAGALLSPRGERTVFPD